MYTKWRNQFIADCSRLGLTIPTIKAILRHSQTYDRLQVAQCNGDWPADTGAGRNGKMRECPDCEGWWQASSFRLTGCPQCRTEKLLNKLIGTDGITGFDFAGDPRGCTVSVKIGEKTLGVPTRGN